MNIFPLIYFGFYVLLINRVIKKQEEDEEKLERERELEKWNQKS